MRDAACVFLCERFPGVIPSAELEQEAPEEQDAQDDCNGDDDDLDETHGRSSASMGERPNRLRGLHSIGVKPGLSTPCGGLRATMKNCPPPELYAANLSEVRCRNGA